jgi:thiosulfate dehydrogenase
MRIMPSTALTVALSMTMVLAAGVARAQAADQAAQPSTPVASKGSKEVKLCDNKTTVQVPDDTPKTAAEGQKIADSLMAQWKTKHPDNRWVAEEVEAHQVVPPEQNAAHVGNGQGSTYGAVSTQDTRVWDNETYKTAVYGSTVFHSGDELGSEIAVSCDMCHPRAANTHPETYPKFQPQLGRVALLRDMINWCIEHPVRGKVLAPDDPKMRALEAYILAQRKGVPLAYGKR